ncbi:hypothetical protein GM31_09430 [Trabulsiella odontotermitis]|uniref:Methyltransferase type 11 domain-containing protein n=1 Tax=Trabulsiella odontotermitis TaxID=379893 RepID=A0A0L0H1J7_9ENTR|nr:hypothetical protein GM31_09430 [Trabulsiella odontotermitis]
MVISLLNLIIEIHSAEEYGILPGRKGTLEINNDICDFYENNFDEANRFSGNPLEFIRSQDIIKRFLTPAPMVIADVAGATGIYSFWLAEQRHQVHLLDLSSKHIEQARQRGKQSAIQLASFTCGDARQLPWDDNTFDMVLLMGALYHLQESGDRTRCIEECFRVLKPGGRAVFAYISRAASLVDGYKYHFLNDPIFQHIVETDLQTGKHENPTSNPHYFTTAFFHTPALITQELQQGSFEEIRIFAVEGFASMIDTDKIMQDEHQKGLLLKHLALTEESSELLGISSHLLAVAKKV